MSSGEQMYKKTTTVRV